MIKTIYSRLTSKKKNIDFVHLMKDPAYKEIREKIFSDSVSGANKQQKKLVEQAQNL